MSVPSDTKAEVQLRGLPFRTTIAEITGFLGSHAQDLVDDAEAVGIMLNRDGRPSGFGRVRFTCASAANACRAALNKKSMGGRYIEVLPVSAKPKTGKSKRAVSFAGDTVGAGMDEGEKEAAEFLLQAEILKFLLQKHEEGIVGDILMSTMGVHISPPSKAYLKRTGSGIKAFLLRFPDLIRIEGPKGCERITLQCLETATATFAEMDSEDLIAEANHTQIQDGDPKEIDQSRIIYMDSKGIDSRGRERDSGLVSSEDLPSTVALRGLPFNATVRDCRHFLGDHVFSLSNKEPAIKLLMNAEHRPSGFAHVWFVSPEAAAACCSELNRKSMGGRYVEVLPATRSKKKKNRLERDARNVADTTDHPGATEDLVIAESLEYLLKDGCDGTAPLSMLGVALSAAARSYYRDSSLKLFLQGFPGEFHIDGARGSERVSLHTHSTGQADTNAPTRQSHPKRSRSDLHVDRAPSYVRLRGLPCNIVEQDVLNFFADHALDRAIARGEGAVEILRQSNGKPSGQVVVQLLTDADVVQKALNNQLYKSSRYIEVFTCTSAEPPEEGPPTSKPRTV